MSSDHLVIGVSSFGTPGPRLAAEVSRAGGLGVVDITQMSDRGPLDQARRWARHPIGVRVGPTTRVDPSCLTGPDGERIRTVILSHDAPWPITDLTATFQVLVEITSLDEARAALAAGAHGVIARGNEAAGRVSDLGSFVLVQHLAAAELGAPFWIWGGIGENTAAAAVAGGAAGVVLDHQLALLPEAELPEQLSAPLRQPDPAATTVTDGHRRLIARGHNRQSSGSAPSAIDIGQDAFLAARFAKRYGSAHHAVSAVLRSIHERVCDLDLAAAFTPDGPGARHLGTRLPLVQGPMARVSDQPAFARSVAEEGGLPFVALSALDKEGAHTLLQSTADALGARPWGAGILGFLPAETQAAHFAAIQHAHPDWVIVAGGRPQHVRRLAAEGIRTFVHVPSPGLLEQFLAQGVHNIVLEGAECGGHLGPLNSFPLWEAQIDIIDRYLADHDTGTTIGVLFAGGISDGRSSAMVAALSAPLRRAGAAVGLLAGTAYLFTHEAVRDGATHEDYQEQIGAASSTVILESAPGHLTRCIPSEYTRAYSELRDQLARDGVPAKEIWERLELSNMGRLRLAAKGVERVDGVMVDVDADRRRTEGLVMAGQVAVLRHSITTIKELHAALTDDALQIIEEARGRIAPDVVADQTRTEPMDIAIIGMSCIFPDANGLGDYWSNVFAGVNSVTEVPDERWSTSIFFQNPQSGAPQSTSKWGAFIPRVALNPLKYGIPPASLPSIEPVQLLALEIVDRALDDAGLADAPFDRSRTAVIFGAESGSDLTGTTALRSTLASYLGRLPAELDAELPDITGDTFPGMLVNVISGRTTNRLDLGGPNYVVDAACASSLAALNIACRELLTGTCDIAVAGGADLHNGIADYIMFSSAQALSPSGQSRPFDHASDGTTLGEGVACVVLKRADQARRDGDRIYAVIKGIGSSSDGRSLGLTAPRVAGQTLALERAYRDSGVSPADIGLLEAHGTGTARGDQSELEALTQVFTDAGAATGACTLGSVKSQIGHTKCAAGMAGLIKVSMALYTGVLPPTLNITQPTSGWDPAHSPFTFRSTPAPWTRPASERKAGVSAFGFGGTNFHVVVEAEARQAPPIHALDRWPAELFQITGDGAATTTAQVQALLADAEAAEANDGPSDLLPLARSHAERARKSGSTVHHAFVARTLDELRSQARAVVAQESPDGPRSTRTTPNPQVAVLFPGQGSQRVGMLSELLSAFPHTCDALVGGGQYTQFSYPGDSFTPDAARARTAALTDTRNAQPALGVANLAVWALLQRCGIQAAGFAGHSYGELCALAAAGSFDTATLLAISAERGEAISNATGSTPGGMAAVAAPATVVATALHSITQRGRLVLANENSPRQTIISGPSDDLAEATTVLAAHGIDVRPLRVSAAFHSPAVAAAAADLEARLCAYTLRAPHVPAWRNRTATPYVDDIAQELASQVAAPVKFVDQIESMYDAGLRVFLEAGPGTVLTRLVDDILQDRPHVAVAVDADGGGVTGFLTALARLSVAGVPVDTDWMFAGRGRPAAFPSEPTSRWFINGQLVSNRDGEPIEGGLRPARTLLSMDSGTTGAAGTALAAPTSALTLVAGASQLFALPSSHEASTTQSTTIGIDSATPSVVPPPSPTVQAHPVHRETETDMTPIENGAEALIARFLDNSRDAVEAQERVLTAFLTGRPVDTVRRPQVTVAMPRTPEPLRLTPTPPALSAPLDGPTARTLPAAAPAIPATPAPRAATPGAEPRPAASPPPAVPQPAPTAPAAPVAPVAESSGVASMTPEEIERRVRELIARRTGYPTEMITADLDLEADLSIDSIKRMEISGELLGGLHDGIENLEDTTVETLSKARTVRSITEWIAHHLGTDGPDPQTSTAPAAPPAPPTPRPQAPMPTAAPVAPQPSAPTPDNGHSGEPLRYRMAARTLPAEPLVDLTIRQVAFLGSPELFKAISAAVPPEVTVEPGEAAAAADALIVDVDDATALPGLFRTLTHTTARLAPRRVLLVGIDRAAQPLRSATDGLPGFARTLALESDASVNLLIVEEDDPAVLASSIVREVRTIPEAPVIALSGGTRLQGVFEAYPLGVLARTGAGSAGQGESAARAIGLDAHSVIVLFGGGRGITAKVAEAFAEAIPCRIELIGSTPAPSAPDAAVQAATTPAEIRAVLVAQGVTDMSDIEATTRRVLAQREVTETIAALTALGSTVNYRTVDVRDPDAVTSAISAIETQHGHITGFVYGSGVNIDLLAADLTPEQFDLVYTTKVDGAVALLNAIELLREQPLFVVGFGSIAALAGNKGQLPYSSANQALDSMLARWGKATGCRTVTMHWGPWSPSATRGGMVSPELEREYVRRGFTLIDPAQGAVCVLDELAWGAPADTSVLYTPAGWVIEQ